MIKFLLIILVLWIIGCACIGYAIGTAVGVAVDTAKDVIDTTSELVDRFVTWFISEDSLGEYIKEEYDDAFYLLIEEKKRNALKVGIFNNQEDVIENIELQSDKGVSDSIYEGQIIYI